MIGLQPLYRHLKNPPLCNNSHGSLDSSLWVNTATSARKHQGSFFSAEKRFQKDCRGRGWPFVFRLKITLPNPKYPLRNVVLYHITCQGVTLLKRTQTSQAENWEKREKVVNTIRHMPSSLLSWSSSPRSVSLPPLPLCDGENARVVLTETLRA